MNKTKKEYLLVMSIVLVALVFVFLANISMRNYSLGDFGVASLVKADCSSIKNASTSSPISISFNSRDVSQIRSQIKTLITKYGGKLKDDSFSSYSGFSEKDPSQDTANMTITFDKSRNEFLAEVSDLVKSSGSTDTGYSYTEGDQAPQYGDSSYDSCVKMMQDVSADFLQLKVFTKAIKRESNPSNISLLSQSISSMKTTLQSDVKNLNNLLSNYEKPSVTISINTFVGYGE